MKRKNRILLAAVMLILVSSTIFYACKKPIEGFDYTINSTVFNYTASLRFQDPSNNNAVPAGIKLTVLGNIASQVYDISGFKNLTVNSQGVVSFGLTESAQPTTADVPVTLLVEATGFRSENVTVIFKKDRANIPLQDVDLLNLTKPQDGVAVKVETVPVSGGIVAAPVTVATPPSTPAAPTTQSAEVTLPANTQLKDAAGNTVNTSSVSIVVANLDVEKPASLGLFPNNSLVQNAVVNNVVQKVAFATAGVTTIEMKAANGTAITNFSQPIIVKTSLDPATVNPNTGTPIKAGDALDYYSYTTATNTWKYESSGFVTSVNGVLSTDIPVTHLSTWISVVKLVTSGVCTQPSSILTITGSNIPSASTDNYRIQFFSMTLGKLIKEVVTTIDQTNSAFTIADLTSGGIQVTILGPLGNIVSQSTLSSLCAGGTINVDLPAPTPTNPVVTIKVTAVCKAGTTPNTSAGFSASAPQGVIVYYRLNQPANGAWSPLGSIVNGQLATSVLNQTTIYDFMTTFTLSNGWVMSPTRTAVQYSSLGTAGSSTSTPSITGNGTAAVGVSFNYEVPSRYCQP